MPRVRKYYHWYPIPGESLGVAVGITRAIRLASIHERVDPNPFGPETVTDPEFDSIDIGLRKNKGKPKNEQ